MGGFVALFLAIDLWLKQSIKHLIMNHWNEARHAQPTNRWFVQVRTIVILSVLLLAGCDRGKPHVIVASKEPNYAQDSEWFRAHEHATRVRSKEWKSTYIDYSQCLVARAAEANLDSGSLSNVLQVILEDAPRKHRFYVPFAAYRADVEHQSVWVVHLAWGYEEYGQLSHRCSYTINWQDLRELGFATCM